MGWEQVMPVANENKIAASASKAPIRNREIEPDSKLRFVKKQESPDGLITEGDFVLFLHRLR